MSYEIYCTEQGEYIRANQVALAGGATKSTAEKLSVKVKYKKQVDC